MPHALLTAMFLGVAGAAAGVIGTAGGITSLVAYPALLAVGIPPLAANVTSSVAMVGSGLASASRAAPDIAGQGRMIRRWIPVSVTLSLAGAVLLVVTPGAVFGWIVPFLVAAGSLTLLVQPRISTWQEDSGHGRGKAAVPAALGAVALYNGYFGAGSGILLIALLLLAGEAAPHRANAAKNVILAVSDLLPAVLFAVTAHVVWAAAIPLGAGTVTGGLVGPSIARRANPGVLRVLIACTVSRSPPGCSSAHNDRRRPPRPFAANQQAMPPVTALDTLTIGIPKCGVNSTEPVRLQRPQ
jgi:uncharacterized membrane protein YfcA